MHSTTNLLRDFVRSEDGLVTVEWVALASALVIGAIAIGWFVMNSLHDPAAVIGNKITTSQSQTPAE
jgi:Flp pilus assembly pilin Flp